MTLELVITNGCNLNCSYCYFKDVESSESMDFKTAQQAVDVFVSYALSKKESILSITYFGGEPLLNWDLIIKITDYTQQKYGRLIKLNYILATNGILLSDEIIDYINQYMFLIYVSIDGNKDAHEKNRLDSSGNSSFEKIVTNSLKLTESRTFIEVVVNPSNVQFLNNSIQYLIYLGFNKLILTCAYEKEWDLQTFSILKKQYKKLLKYYLKLKKGKNPDLKISLFDDKIKLSENHSSYKKTTCDMGESTFVVSVDGEIFPCTRFVNTNLGVNYSMGNIFSGMKAEKMAIINEYKKTDKKECIDCKIKKICLGNNCGCIGYSSSGNINDVNPFICEHERYLCKLLHLS